LSLCAKAERQMHTEQKNKTRREKERGLKTAKKKHKRTSCLKREGRAAATQRKRRLVVHPHEAKQSKKAKTGSLEVKRWPKENLRTLSSDL